ncbi:MAG: phosphatidylglycerophosphatase A [Bacteroidota bacterium]|nr:phosphatidylglycerophosphatase A [Bacteroidota bacterium]
MRNLNHWIAACMGIGYLKGGGTIAAMVTALAWWLLRDVEHFTVWSVILTGLVILVGTITATKVESDWGKDSSRVVIDEVAGMCVTLLFVPVSVLSVLSGLVLFRFFDIVKPGYIRKMENLPAGKGVMADDLLAGVYSNLIVHVILYLYPWQHF